jgi:hypothetical protein
MKRQPLCAAPLIADAGLTTDSEAAIIQITNSAESALPNFHPLLQFVREAAGQGHQK